MNAQQLRWNTLLGAALVGIGIVVAVWWAGPGVLGSVTTTQGTPSEATVTVPASCTAANATETVRFEFGGQTHTGSLDACGNDANDRVNIVVPTGIGTGEVAVHLADVVPGHGSLRRSVALALLALSCVGGGTYAFLVHRGPRRRAALGT
jgi:hypothetical protein